MLHRQSHRVVPCLAGRHRLGSRPERVVRSSALSCLDRWISARSVRRCVFITAELWSKNLSFCTIQAESKWQRVTITLYPVRAYSMPTGEVPVAPIADEWLAE